MILLKIEDVDGGGYDTSTKTAVKFEVEGFFHIERGILIQIDQLTRFTAILQFEEVAATDTFFIMVGAIDLIKRNEESPTSKLFKVVHRDMARRFDLEDLLNIEDRIRVGESHSRGGWP